MKNGLRPAPKKVRAIKECRTPQSKEEETAEKRSEDWTSGQDKEHAVG